MREYKTINVSLEVWQLLQDISAVTGDPMKEVTEEAVKNYIKNKKALREKLLVYREMMGRLDKLD